MTALPESWDVDRYFTPEEYLAFEKASATKHEYVNGFVRAMAGADLRHNYVSSNLIGELMVQLRGKACAAFGSDKSLKVTIDGGTYFYYPDVTVDCSAQKGYHTLAPTVLIEIASASTRRIDDEEKLTHYSSIPSLRVYARVERDAPKIVLLRRELGGEWLTETISGLEATFELPEIGCALPMRFIYDRVEFPA